MDLTSLGKYFIAVVLILAGLALMALGKVDIGVVVILTGFGFLGLSKETEDIKKALKK